MENQDINLEKQESQEQTNQCDTTSTNSSTAEQSPELKAALDLIKESNETISNLNKQIAELKQSNAKLAIQQTLAAPAKEAEDIINDMFK